MNMMSFFRHRSFGLGPNYRASLTRDVDFFDTDIEPTEAGVMAWHPGQSLVARWARLPEEEVRSLPPLSVRPDYDAIARDDRFADLRPAEDAAFEDPADLLMRLVQALRRERADKRRAGRFSALSLAWRLRKLDREQVIDAKADAQVINEILSRMASLPD
jgi:hypothetical protein